MRFTGSFDEFMEKVLREFPYALVEENSDGELVILTSCFQKGDSSINNNNYVQEYKRE